MNQVNQTGSGFFKSLFDFSFKTYITPTIIKIVYAIVMVLAGLSALALVVISFRASANGGVFELLIVAPIVFLFYVILYRIFLEVTMAIFTIAENTTRMANAAAPAPAVPPYTPPAPPAPPAGPTGWNPPPPAPPGPLS